MSNSTYILFPIEFASIGSLLSHYMSFTRIISLPVLASVWNFSPIEAHFLGHQRYRHAL